VRRDDDPLVLTECEFSLLAYLALRKDQVVTGLEIEDHLHHQGRPPRGIALESAVRNLGVKLSVYGSSCGIQTRHGSGYVLRDGSA
jgi:DNA-binding response OmpR family regulator